MTTGTDSLKAERPVPQQLLRHPDAARTESFRRWVAKQQRPLAIDLFSGCGGLSLGLEQAGYAVVLAVDHDPWALQTHDHNFAGKAIGLDLSDPEKVEGLLRLLEGLPPIELVAGGPPCQPFSRAGRSMIRSLVRAGVRSAKDERTELWQSFLSIVERLRPAAMMLENVPDMALGDELAIPREMAQRLDKAGYDVHMRLVDGWRLGVPQHRQRLILVALRDGQAYTWPADQKKITLREAIGDLPRLRGGQGRPEMRVVPSSSPFQRRARAGMKGSALVWDHIARQVRADDLEAFRLMKPGTRYSDLPKHLKRYRDDIFNDKYNRLPWDDVSRSITAHLAKDGYWYIHPSEQRTLTVREAARIQTFPDHFRFAGTRSHAFRQIGNAVPPALAEAIGREIAAAVRAGPAPSEKRVSYRLALIRATLLKWGAKDGKKAPWRHPGRPWQVLAGVCLGERVGAHDEAAEAFLERFPSPTRAASKTIAKDAKQRSGNKRDALLALARTARCLANDRRGWANGQWAKAAALGAADEAMVRTLGFGEERVLTPASSLRVVARLTASDIDEKRQLANVRLAAALLVGRGKQVPAINAAVYALGRVICTSKNPNCRRCPLVRYCPSSGLEVTE